MDSLNTLYFPVTDLYSIRQYPIFLLFQKVHLLRPVEEAPPGAGKGPADSFIKSGICQVHTPCPLGENRDRFLHLVDAIRHRKDDYAAQLSSLILASTSGAPAADDNSEQEIIKSLLAPTEQREASAQLRRKEKLWQARLVLALGEILDQEEEEIARNLAILDDDQAGLFRELHGEMDEIDEDNPFTELSQLESKLGAAHSGNLRTRFNGWTTLFLEGNLPECEIFLTTSQDSGELLLELYEQKTNRAAPLVAELELPGLIGWNSGEALQTVTTFVDRNRPLLSRLHQALADLWRRTDLATEQSGIGAGFAALAEEWRVQLEKAFPAQQYGRIPVKCYLFPGVRCATLVGKPLPHNPACDEPKNGLLVIAD